jgi:hypothetical protein
MQEHRSTGEDVLTEQVSAEDIMKALEDQRNQAVTIHKAGAEFKANGIDYRVTSEGRIESKNKAKRRAKNKAARKARKKNRK